MQVQTMRMEGRGFAHTVREALDRVRRWRLRREAQGVVRTPYGEPPFPFTVEQWEEYCRNEETLGTSDSGENGSHYLR